MRFTSVVFGIGFLATLVSACGDGPERDTRLADLDQGDVRTLCASAEPREVDCGNGLVVTTNDEQSCVDTLGTVSEDCSATVGHYEDCSDDPCDQMAACFAMANCG